MPAKKPKIPILKRELTANTMKYVTRLTDKKYIKPLKKSKKKEGVERSKKIGQYLLKRKFRSSPEESFAVKILYSKKKSGEKAEAIVNYLIKTKKLEKKVAVDKAVELLSLIKQKAQQKYITAYQETAIKIHGKGKEYKKNVSGQEHIFSVDRLYMGIELVINKIKEIK